MMNKELSQNTRKQWIDCLRGMAMLFVILGHFLPKNDQNWVYFVFTSPIKIPLFFAITGYVFNDRNGDIVRFCSNLLKKIIIPWLALSLLPIICFSVINGWDYFLEGLLNILTGESVWYMPCCIAAEIIWFSTHKIAKHETLRIILSTLIAVLAFILTKYVFIGKSIILTAMIAQGYMTIGYCIKHFINPIVNEHKFSIFVGTIVYIVIGIASCIFCYGENLDVHLNRYYSPILCGTMICLGIIVLFGVGEVYDIKDPILSFVGRNTLVFYIWAIYPIDILEMMLNRFNIVLPDNNLVAILYLIISSVACGLIAILLNKYIPEIVGKPRKKHQAK